MYGSIRKSYGAKRASRSTETTERKLSLFARKNKKRTKNPTAYEDTSYVNVENPAQTNRNARVNTPVQDTNKNGITKNEFPIASVILTIVFTMMVMVLAFGIGG